MIKTVEFSNTKYERIKGVLKGKKSNNTLLPLIIVCHGFKSSKDHPANVSITDKLYDLGYTTFCFDFSQSAQGLHLRQQVEDIRDVISFFKQYKKIIILAGSLGSLSAAIATSQSARIDGLITLNGFFGASQAGIAVLKQYLLFRILCLFNASYRDAWKFLKKNYLPKKIICDTLIIHARYDKAVFSSQSEDFFNKVSGNKELILLDEGDHHLTRDTYRQETVESIDRWLKNRF